MSMRALLFDAGGILYHRPRRWDRTRAFLSELQLPYVNSDHPTRMALKVEAHAGHLTELEYHDALLDLFGVQNPSDRLRGEEILHREERDIEFFEGVGETLHRLKDLGYLLGIVTNTHISTEEKRRWFRQVSIDDIWDSFATSCEIGIVKPDPSIYLAALDPIGVPATDTAFVGHSARELEGACALGMVTIGFDMTEEISGADYVITRFSDLLEIVHPIV